MALDQSKHYKDPIEFLNNSRYDEFGLDGDKEILPADDGKYVYYSDAVEAVEYANELAINNLTLYKVKVVMSPGIVDEIIVNSEKVGLEEAETHLKHRKPITVHFYKCIFNDGVLTETEKIF